MEIQEDPKQYNVSFAEYNLLEFLHTSYNNKKLYFAMNQAIVLIFVIVTVGIQMSESQKWFLIFNYKVFLLSWYNSFCVASHIELRSYIVVELNSYFLTRTIIVANAYYL